MTRNDSFGVLSPRYEITDDRVAIVRRRAPWLVWLVPLSAALFAVTWPRLVLGGVWLALFVIEVMLAFLGLFAVPQLFGAARIDVTRDGVQWGKHGYAPGDLADVWLSGRVAIPKPPNRLVTSYAYYFRVTTKRGKARMLTLATTAYGFDAIERKLSDLAAAMGPLFAATGVKFVWHGGDRG